MRYRRFSCMHAEEAPCALREDIFGALVSLHTQLFIFMLHKLHLFIPICFPYSGGRRFQLISLPSFTQINLFRNFIKSNRNQIVYTILRLI